MSSVGQSLDATATLTRRQLCETFCTRLSDDALRLAVGSKFDALLLWRQRDAAYDALVKNGGSVPEVTP